MLYLKKAEVIREFQELYSLRYRVFCIEKHGLEPSDYPDKKEKDKYIKKIHASRDNLRKFRNYALALIEESYQIPDRENFGWLFSAD